MRLLEGLTFYLASGSPRRLILLNQIGIEPIVKIPQRIEEKGLDESPEELVLRLSFQKAKEIFEQVNPSSLVLGADTIVYLDGKILGKPTSKEDAFHILSSLSGRIHEVYTGLAVFYQDKIYQKAIKTKVAFGKLSDEEIYQYIETGEPMDKAGAYGIQGQGAVFIEKIDGCYFNVVGLPLHSLWKILQDAGALK